MKGIDNEQTTSHAEPEDLLDKLQKELKKQIEGSVPAKEDDVKLSTGMLSIPEVDLGISAKVKNIEETERAARAVEQAAKVRCVLHN